MKKKIETKNNQTASKPLLAQPAVINRLFCYLFGHDNEMYTDSGYWMHKCKRCEEKKVLWKQNDYSLDKC